MTSDDGWSEYAFPDLIDFREGPGIMARDFRETGVPLVRLAGLSGPSLLAGCNYLDPELVEHKWSHFRLKAGDTLLSTSATLGRVTRVAPDDEGAIPYTGIIRMRPRDDRIDPDYIPYLLAGSHFQRQVEAMGAGSVMRHFGPTHLRSMTLVIPPRLEQQRITAVLGALDEKVSGNRRLSRLLEETAATEFRRRFVGAIAPSDSTGAAPDWKISTLGSLAELATEQLKPADTPDAQFEHFSIPAFDAGNGPVLEPGVSMLSAKTMVPGRECVLLSKLNPKTRRVWWPWPRDSAVAVCSTEFLVLVPRQGIPTSYVYGVASQDDRFYDELLSHASGTTGSRQRVKPTEALACRALVPKAEALRAWDGFARPLYDHAHNLGVESRALADIRGHLLPKLVSGVIRLSDSADAAETMEPLVAEGAAW